jgi:hypothetical protein
LFLVIISIAAKFWIDDDNVIVLVEPLSFEYKTVSRYTAKLVRAAFAVVAPVPPFDIGSVAVLVIPEVPLPKRIWPLDKLVCPVPPFATDTGKYVFAWLIL